MSVRGTGMGGVSVSVEESTSTGSVGGDFLSVDTTGGSTHAVSMIITMQSMERQEILSFIFAFRRYYQML